MSNGAMMGRFVLLFHVSVHLFLIYLVFRQQYLASASKDKTAIIWRIGVMCLYDYLCRPSKLMASDHLAGQKRANDAGMCS
jgi:hypothetical protein